MRIEDKGITAKRSKGKKDTLNKVIYKGGQTKPLGKVKGPNAHGFYNLIDKNYGKNISA